MMAVKTRLSITSHLGRIFVITSTVLDDKKDRSPMTWNNIADEKEKAHE